MVSEIGGTKPGAVTALEQGGSKIDKTRPSAPAAPSAIKQTDVVTLTDLAAKLQALTSSVADIPVADQQRISEFQQLIADGAYHVDSAAVAEKMASMESLLAELKADES